jgi:hypothetical protein
MPRRALLQEIRKTYDPQQWIKAGISAEIEIVPAAFRALAG